MLAAGLQIQQFDEEQDSAWLAIDLDYTSVEEMYLGSLPNFGNQILYSTARNQAVEERNHSLVPST